MTDAAPASWASLDALLHPVAVLCACGDLCFANASWRRAINAGKLCDDPLTGGTSVHGDRALAVEVRAGLESVLQGTVNRAEIELHCEQVHGGRRRLTATPCEVHGARGALLQILEGPAVPAPAAIPAPPPSSRRLRSDASAAARCDSTVLLLGESGVGKTHLAREIHEQSRRAAAPFVDINCAGLSAALLESELFGHERGAFTGAAGRKRGLLEEAATGTVFLDEIGELDAIVQAKLLKVLESRRFRRLGSTREIATQARIIAATSRDLAAEVAAGRFREDLYYRVCVLVIAVAPLRDRRDEIPDLAARLLADIPRERGRPVPALGPGALAVLQSHRWPGNVRELRNVLERATLGGNPIIEAEDVRAAVAPRIVSAPDLAALAESEREHVERVLAATRWNLRRAAQILGISRSTLYERVRRYGIDLRLARASG